MTHSASRYAFLLGLATLSFTESRAAQFGPQFPSHRFPTDESFHVGYKISRATSDSNFIDTLSLKDLDNSSVLSIWKHEVQVEYQPNRALAFGGLFSFDRTKLTAPNEAYSESSGFRDQYLWGEYRFFDQPGASLGFAVLVKVPAYGLPDPDSTENGMLTVPGDAQTDYTGMFTSEYWANETFRFRGDVGYTLRTNEFAPEMPYLVSAGFVTPKFEIDLKLRGNLNVGEDSYTGDTARIDATRTAFASSKYALATQPWTLVINPTVEFWLNPRWAIGLDFQYSLMGSDSAAFSHYGLSLTYRWAKSVRRSTRTFKEVGIDTDQESGNFQGEDQDRAVEPKAEDAAPIPNEPEEEIFD